MREFGRLGSPSGVERSLRAESSGIDALRV
jgi:hypothetical protein